MRIHSDVLTRGDIFGAASGIESVWVDKWTEHGSRSRKRAFEVALRGAGTRHTRWPNSGKFGADHTANAATYDDWGDFLSNLFDVDPDMIAGLYRGKSHFHVVTNFKYWKHA